MLNVPCPILLRRLRVFCTRPGSIGQQAHQRPLQAAIHLVQMVSELRIGPVSGWKPREGKPVVAPWWVRTGRIIQGRSSLIPENARLRVRRRPRAFFSGQSAFPLLPSPSHTPADPSGSIGKLGAGPSEQPGDQTCWTGTIRGLMPPGPSRTVTSNLHDFPGDRLTPPVLNSWPVETPPPRGRGLVRRTGESCPRPGYRDNQSDGCLSPRREGPCPRSQWKQLWGLTAHPPAGVSLHGGGLAAMRRHASSHSMTHEG